ncbi:hypothetical protein J7M00_02795 [bacterium]|nr:hypothetical protein [bacterium]
MEKKNVVLVAFAVASISLLVVYLQELNVNRQLYDQLIQLQDSLNQMQAEISHLNQSQALLRQEKQHLEQHVQKLKQQTNLFEQQIESLQREKQQLEQQVGALQRERQRLQALLAEKNSQLESLQKQVATLSQRNRNLQYQLEKNRLINVTVYVLFGSNVKMLRIENVTVYNGDKQVFYADLNVTIVRNGTRLLSLTLPQGQITLQCSLVKFIVQQQQGNLEFVFILYGTYTASDTFEEDTEWYVRM